jgi:predicted small lipoprotein YifL
MFSALRTILVSAATLGSLVACGQKGPLFLPTGEAAAGRATLTETLAPETLRPAQAPAAPASAPPTGTASPVRTP